MPGKNSIMAATQNISTPLQFPWFETPFFGALLASSNLSADDRELVQNYAREGYVIVDIGIDDFSAKADSMISAIAKVYDEAGQQKNSTYNGDAKRIQDAWRYNTDVKDFACAPKILRILQMLYQRAPIPFQTLNFPVGTQQPTHSDSIHFNSLPHHFMCGVWLALEDTDRENGPLHYYPGSHKLPIFHMHDFGITTADYPNQAESYVLYENAVEKLMLASGLERKELHIKKGQALIWAANLFHGGNAIIDNKRSRHSQVTHYYFENCAYYTPRISDVPDGRIYWRNDITSILTGKPVPCMLNGKPVKNHNMLPPGVPRGTEMSRARWLVTCLYRRSRNLYRYLVH